MTATVVTRWSRRFVGAGALFLVAWQAAALLGASRRAQVYLAVFGFVFHVVFGKAYALVPAYFERSLSPVRAPAVQFPLTALGTACLAGAALGGPSRLATVGAALWMVGVAVFVGTLVWTLRGNLAGQATGTGEANADRRPVDRYANPFVPAVLAYLAVGSWDLLAGQLGLPVVLADSPAAVSHLLAAGGAALLLFAVGFRLLPRFLVAHLPRSLVAVILPAGALGPAIIAATLPAGSWFRVGAALEALAVVGFAVTYVALFWRSDRRRVGFCGVLAGVVAGTLAALLGLMFAFVSFPVGGIVAHFRLNVLGFLGLSIVGVSYQFYPPAVGGVPGSSDRAAFASLALLGVGLGLEVAGVLAGLPTATVVGRLAGVAGALVYVYLLFGMLFVGARR